MKIIDKLNQKGIHISFEVFPSKTDAGFDKVLSATDEIAKLNPSYISVTYGAGGGTSKNTAKIASHIKDDLGVMSLAHLTCASSTKEEVGEVIENLKLDMDYKKFREIISIDNSSDSRIIHISVKNRDAELAARIVNELSYVSADFFGDSMEVAPPKIIDEGEIPTEKTSPSMIKNTIMGILAGILLTCVILTVMTVTDDTIKSEDGIEKYLGIPVLASIPDRQDYISSGRKNKKRKRK